MTINWFCFDHMPISFLYDGNTETFLIILIDRISNLFKLIYVRFKILKLNVFICNKNYLYTYFFIK